MHYVEIHSLHTYIGSLLNRDENGEAKRISIGGQNRTRISSQSLKNHWRHADDQYAIGNVPGATEAVRSRNTVRELVVKPLREAGLHSDQLLDAVEHEFNRGVYGANAGAEQHRQSLLLGRPEVEFLQTKAREICEQHPDNHTAATQAVQEMFDRKRPEGRNLRAFITGAQLPYGLITAMFGRMVTSDTQASIDSAISVAHAFTVHEAEPQPEFFTAVDDLADYASNARTSMLSTTEINSGIYYGYVVIDVRQLISNCEAVTPAQWRDADPEVAARTAQHLIHLIATVSPGAKRGSTAPFTRADLMLVETGDHQPRSLAKAYLTPAGKNLTAAIQSLCNHIERDDQAWGNERRRRFTSIEDVPIPGAESANLKELARWAADQIRQARSN